MIRRRGAIQYVKQLAGKKQLRLGVGLSITFVTLGLFYYYLHQHNELLHQLLHTPLLTLAALLGLFALWFGSMALILQAILRMCNLEIAPGENLALNAYSTFLNYLLPGQGGAVLRGLYLKGRHKLPFGRYLFATIVYYVFYAGVSMLLLIGGIRAWWQTLLAVLGVSLVAFMGARMYARKHHMGRRSLSLSLENLSYLMLATCAQAICQVLIYWVELGTVAPGLKLGQVMSYTGAADFALFVNITPGAVGIRETFLIFSERLHHIANTAIVGANVLDRATYIVFLGLIFGVLVAVRGKAMLTTMRAYRRPTEPVMVEEELRPRLAADPAASVLK